MGKKRNNVIKAAFLGTALGVTVGSASASELLEVRGLGTGQSIRNSVMQGQDMNGTAQANPYAAHESKDGGEGKCGEGKCGEGKCGEDKKAGSSSSDKSGEGKCGEGKCGEGKE